MRFGVRGFRFQGRISTEADAAVHPSWNTLTCGENAPRMSDVIPVPDTRSSRSLGSRASRELIASGTVQFEDASAYTLTLDFRSAPDTKADLRPELPLILRW